MLLNYLLNRNGIATFATEEDMKTSELKRYLKSNGCYELYSGKEHDVWYSTHTGAKMRIPRHQSQEIPRGTLNSILKQAGLNN